MTDTKKRIQPNRIAKRLEQAMRILYSIFEPYSKIPYQNRARHQMYMPAKETFEKFWKLCEEQQIDIAYGTFRRAKKALGIKSKRIGAPPRKKGQSWTYIWMLPTKTPDQIINIIRANKERAIDKRKEEEQLAHLESRKPENHWSCVELRDFMIASSFMCRAPEVWEYWRQAHGKGKGTLNHAKKVLGVISIKKEDIWYWVYPAPVVCDWLIKRLERGPVPVDVLTAEAEDAGWVYDVLHQAKIKTGMRDLFVQQGDERVRLWFDASVNPDLVATIGEGEDNAEESRE